MMTHILNLKLVEKSVKQISVINKLNHSMEDT